MAGQRQWPSGPSPMGRAGIPNLILVGTEKIRFREGSEKDMWRRGRGKGLTAKTDPVELEPCL